MFTVSGVGIGEQMLYMGYDKENTQIEGSTQLYSLHTCKGSLFCTITQGN